MWVRSCYSQWCNHRNMSPSCTYYWESAKHIRLHRYIPHSKPQTTLLNVISRALPWLYRATFIYPKTYWNYTNYEVINAAPEFFESITHLTFPYIDYWRGYWMESRLEGSKISRRLVTIPGKANNSVNNFVKLRESSVRGCAWWLHRRISTRK